MLDCYIPSLPKEPDFEKKFRGFTKNEGSFIYKEWGKKQNIEK